MTENILAKIRAEQVASNVDLDSLAKKIADYKYESTVKSEILHAAVKNLYFLTAANQFLVSELKKVKRNRDLDESQVVFLEIKTQLLAAQIERVLEVAGGEREHQEAVLGMLLNKQVIEVNGGFLKMNGLAAAGDEGEGLSIVLEKLLDVFSLINVGLSKLARSCVDRVAGHVLN